MRFNAKKLKEFFLSVKSSRFLQFCVKNMPQAYFLNTPVLGVTQSLSVVYDGCSFAAVFLYVWGCIFTQPLFPVRE